LKVLAAISGDLPANSGVLNVYPGLQPGYNLATTWLHSETRAVVEFFSICSHVTGYFYFIRVRNIIIEGSNKKTLPLKSLKTWLHLEPGYTFA
jgi:hypothetical protein